MIRYCRTGIQRTGLEALVAKLSKNTVMVELGSFAGESTKIFAKHCKTVYAVDLWAESAAGMAKSVGSAESAGDIEARFDKVARNNPNIIKIKASTTEAFKQFKDESIDFVYIDAQHEYKFVKEDSVNWIPKVKLNGYVGGHDYNKVLWPGCIQAVTELFGDQVEIFEDTSWLAKASDEKISMLMPAYNREHLIEFSIRCILNQTYKNIELFVYDDGSKDYTVKVIEEIQKTDTRLKLIKGTVNKGCAEARNILLQQTETRLAGWIDSDDLHNIHKIEIQFPYVRDGKNVVFTAAKKFITSEQHSLNLYKTPEKKDMTFSWKDCQNVGNNRCNPTFFCDCFTPCTLFPVDKSCVFNYGNHINILGDDCVFLNQMAKKYNFKLLPEILGFYRMHENSLIHVFGTAKSKLSKDQFSQLTVGEIIDKFGKNISVTSTKYNIPEYTKSQLKISYKEMTTRAIVTMANGPFYRYVGTLTHPTIKKYAEKCKADFIILQPDELNDHKITHWNKFKLKDLLQEYDRILYIDTDIIISEDSPDLFDIVPVDRLGIFNELDLYRGFIDKVYQEYLEYLELDKTKYFDDNFYFNSGVILFSKEHKYLFNLPKKLKSYTASINDYRNMLVEQHYFNILFHEYKFDYYDIGVIFNAEIKNEICGKILEIPFSKFKFIHFAGIFSQYYKYTEFLSIYEHAEAVINYYKKRHKLEIDSIPPVIINIIKQDPTKVIVKGPYSNMIVRLGFKNIEFKNYRAKISLQDAKELIKRHNYTIISE